MEIVVVEGDLFYYWHTHVPGLALVYLHNAEIRGLETQHQDEQRYTNQYHEPITAENLYRGILRPAVGQRKSHYSKYLLSRRRHH